MSKSSPQKIGIVGAGLGGLATACTLAARGYSVTLFERNSWLGGKAACLEANGFRFDMGPTILTMPSILRRFFSDAGRRMEAYLQLTRLEPQRRCFAIILAVIWVSATPISLIFRSACTGFPRISFLTGPLAAFSIWSTGVI